MLFKDKFDNRYGGDDGLEKVGVIGSFEYSPDFAWDICGCEWKLELEAEVDPDLSSEDPVEVAGPSTSDKILASEDNLRGILQGWHKPFSNGPDDEHLWQEIETRGDTVRAVSLSLQLIHKNCSKGILCGWTRLELVFLHWWHSITLHPGDNGADSTHPLQLSSNELSSSSQDFELLIWQKQHFPLDEFLPKSRYVTELRTDTESLNFKRILTLLHHLAVWVWSCPIC